MLEERLCMYVLHHLLLYIELHRLFHPRPTIFVQFVYSGCAMKMERRKCFSDAYWSRGRLNEGCQPSTALHCSSHTPLSLQHCTTPMNLWLASWREAPTSLTCTAAPPTPFHARIALFGVQLNRLSSTSSHCLRIDQQARRKRTKPSPQLITAF